MAKTIIINADDFGLSRGINDGILESIDKGVVRRISLMANGHDFEYAIGALKLRPTISVRVHLNLTEGKPLSPADEVPHLVDDHGYFNNSFFSLWLRSTFADPDVKKALAEEIAKEIEAQVIKIKTALGLATISLDGHQHIHVVPGVMETLIGLAPRLSITEIRYGREPLHIPLQTLLRSPRTLILNPIKHFVYNFLSWRVRKPVARAGFASPDYVAGIMASGFVGVDSLLAAAAAVPDGKSLEVILHPGGAAENERRLWDNVSPIFASFYYSPGRTHERELATNPTMPALLLKAAEGGSGTLSEKLSAHLWQITKYFISGGTAAGVHLLVAFVALTRFDTTAVEATAAGFLTAYGVSFVLQKFWTFEDRGTHRIGLQALQYFVTGVLGLGSNMAGTYLAVNVMGMPDMLGLFIVTFLVSVATFGIYKFLIFRR